MIVKPGIDYNWWHYLCIHTIWRWVFKFELLFGLKVLSPRIMQAHNFPNDRNWSGKGNWIIHWTDKLPQAPLKPVKAQQYYWKDGNFYNSSSHILLYIHIYCFAIDRPRSYHQLQRFREMVGKCTNQHEQLILRCWRCVHHRLVHRARAVSYS